MTVRRLLSALVLLCAAATVANAHADRPAFLGLTEVAPGRFEMTWKVPRTGDQVLSMTPVLPEAFQQVGETRVEALPTERVEQRVLEADPWLLAGSEVGVEGPGSFLIQTLVRIQFADRSVVMRILRPGDPPFPFPDRRSALSIDSDLEAATIAQDTVLEGGRHVFLTVTHLLFALALGLAFGGTAFGSPARLRALTLFFGAHVVGIILGRASGLSLHLLPVEVLLGVSAAIAVRAALRPGTRTLLLVVVAVGLIHGVAFASEWKTALGPLLGLTLGVDAAQFVIASLAGALLRRTAVRKAACYFAGFAGMAAAAYALTCLPVDAPAAPTSLISTENLPGALSATPDTAPAAVATATGDAVFLYIEPFETRVEAVWSLADLAQGAGLEVGGKEHLEVAEQAAVLRRIDALIEASTSVIVDYEPTGTPVSRIDFVTRTAQGVLEREVPVVESVGEALIGIVRTYATGAMPRSIEFRWEIGLSRGGATLQVEDPERLRTVTLSPGEPTFRWVNELRAEPLPTVESVSRREPTIGISILSLLALALAVVLGVWLARKVGVWSGLTAARLLLAGAAVLAPIWPISLPVPGDPLPPEPEAEAIAEALLTNVYRAFEHRAEDRVYDRLAVSVAGDQLSEVYVAHRRNMELEGQGGARARVEGVEVEEARAIAPLDGGGFSADVSWTVSGFVSHFGHRHFRQNHYDARLRVRAHEGTWKILGLEVLEKTRVQ